MPWNAKTPQKDCLKNGTNKQQRDKNLQNKRENFSSLTSNWGSITVKEELSKNNYILHDSEVTAMVCKDSLLLLFLKMEFLWFFPITRFQNQIRVEWGFGRVFGYWPHVWTCGNSTIQPKQKNRNRFWKFLDLLKKHKFKIYMDYFSFFAKSVLLNGMIGKHKINFIITDVNKIDFIFE